MANKYQIPVTVLLLLLVLYIVGPRVDTSYTLKPVSLPEDIEEYLSSSEAQYTDITNGAEKIIHWADPTTRRATRYSIVYLHGFSATRQEISPLCEQLAKQMNANLYFTRLTGHGRAANAMGNITVSDLLNDAYEALEIGKKIGEKVILIGTSTGGSLATWLAALKGNSALSALILLSPNYGLNRKASELMLQPWGDLILSLVQGDEYQFATANDLQKKYWTTRYPSQALLPMMGVVDVARNSNFKQITVPVLLLYSEQDKIVDVEKIKMVYNRLGSARKQLVPVETMDPQGHVLAGDILSPNTSEELLIKIEQFLESGNSP